MANLNYIKFDELMASVETDLYKFADNGLINRGSCIKIARKVNHDLGLKIFREKETVIKIKDYKAEMPEDFMFLQLALICSKPQEYNLPVGNIWGTQTYENNVEVGCTAPVNACLNSCDGAYWVTQVYKEKTVKVSDLRPIKLTNRSLRYCADKCVNVAWNSCTYDIDIQDGQAVTNFREGDVYISYLSDMVDEDNNVLILAHPLLIPFYEYAIKKHLLETFMLNGEADVQQMLQYINEQHKEARILAISFTNTVEYTDIQDIFMANRSSFYNKYFKMFEPWY